MLGGAGDLADGFRDCVGPMLLVIVGSPRWMSFHDGCDGERRTVIHVPVWLYELRVFWESTIRVVITTVATNYIPCAFAVRG